MTWIVPPAFRKPTPNIWTANDGAVRPVEFAVYHYTAGDLAPSIRTLCDPARKASAHFVVDRNGDIWQLASLDDRTWHAGGTKESPSLWRRSGRVNQRSFGIEIVNWGPLIKRDVSWTCWTGRSVNVSVWIDPKKDTSFWEAYSDQQVRALEDLTKRLVQLYPILGESADRLVGHSDVDPRRKVDPGPAFPWHRIRYAASAARQM